MDAALLEKNATEVATILKAAGNPKRLMVLCRLVQLGRATVNEIARSVDLSQSALSQHLAVMREEGLVTCTRDGQMMWYEIADRRIVTLLETLQSLYCETEKDDR